jgi:hypothetical protein
MCEAAHRNTTRSSTIFATASSRFQLQPQRPIRGRFAVMTILVPLDGSILAEQVLPYVGILAPMLEAKICLLCVVEDTAENGLPAGAGMFYSGTGGAQCRPHRW